MRLIDIDDISLRKTIACGGLSAKALWRRIQQQPIIDAVSVVRCGECKHKQQCRKAVEHITHEPASVTIGYKSVDFCSYGERSDK